MTRQQCEERLLSLAQQMRDAFLEYNHAGEHLSVTIGDDGFISIRDGFFTGENRDVVLDVNGGVFSSVNVTKYSNGYIRHGSGSLDV